MRLDQQISAALGDAGLKSPQYDEIGAVSWPSAFAVSDLAVASIGAACAEIAALDGRDRPVTIDRRLASLRFSLTLQPQGWALPPVWDDLAGVYRTEDGFIRLHTNAPHHKAAALAAIGCPADREQVERAVTGWDAEALETAVVTQGGCAARMMSGKTWRAHPQGRAVSTEPLIAWAEQGQARRSQPFGTNARPLSGLKVLDLTRVLAGPVCTRFLAGFGATVLRIDPPGWQEELVETEVTPGKRLATLDLKTAEGRDHCLALMAEADILVHGYRNGALEALGLGDEARHRANPDLIDVALNAYGWTGPWSQRRGFDSLVQMSSGITHRGMAWKLSDMPVPLPVQALDFATGYLMAAAVGRALRIRRAEGRALSARLSLARTSMLLQSTQADNDGTQLDPMQPSDLANDVEQTDWGPGQRVHFPADMPVSFDSPARRLHADPAAWP